MKQHERDLLVKAREELARLSNIVDGGGNVSAKALREVVADLDGVIDGF